MEDELLFLANASGEANQDLADYVGVETVYSNWCGLDVELEIYEPWYDDGNSVYWGGDPEDVELEYSGPIYGGPVFKNGFTTFLVSRQDGGDPSWMVFKDENKIDNKEQ